MDKKLIKTQDEENYKQFYEKRNVLKPLSKLNLTKYALILYL